MITLIVALELVLYLSQARAEEMVAYDPSDRFVNIGECTSLKERQAKVWRSLTTVESKSYTPYSLSYSKCIRDPNPYHPGKKIKEPHTETFDASWYGVSAEADVNKTLQTECENFRNELKKQEAVGNRCNL